MTSGTLLESIAGALQAAGMYAPDDQEPAAAVLWPDPQRSWEPVVGQLRDLVPLLTLGEYDPDSGVGPAYWIRCLLSGSLPGLEADDSVPVLYLPGVSRDDFRSAEEAPDAIRPLIELQYRGVFWKQPNGREWTPLAYLMNREKGLGVSMNQDTATAEALATTLHRLVGQPVDWFQHHQPVTAHALLDLVQPDFIGSLLRWIDDPSAFETSSDPAEWTAFKAKCNQEMGFDPDRHGALTAAKHLGERQGQWAITWERFSVAPGAYPGIPGRLRSARPAVQSLFENADAWPQDNEEAEAELRGKLADLADAQPANARTAVQNLEILHNSRRYSVWAKLGQAPLAEALEHLIALGDIAESVPGGTLRTIAERYVEDSWRADLAVLRALSAVVSKEDTEAIAGAVRALYGRWLDDSVRAFQQAAMASPEQLRPPAAHAHPTGTCMLFTDGLRYDVGNLLADALRARNLGVELDWHFAAVPTVTQTAKPAISPVADLFEGGDTGFDPIESKTGTKVTAPVLRRNLDAEGWQALAPTELGDPSGRGWTEMGDLDSIGHKFGIKLAARVESEVRQIADRISELLRAGWNEVRVVTDHGFLLLPGDLETVKLEKHLTETRKGRCARLAMGVEVDQPQLSWFWDQNVKVALAPGLACYEGGKSYEHGGLSAQECVVPTLRVSTAGSPPTGVPEITKVTWLGLLCRVEFRNVSVGVLVDIRGLAADDTTSIAAQASETKTEARVSLLVPDDDLEGEQVFVVIVDADGQLLAQRETVVGSNE